MAIAQIVAGAYTGTYGAVAMNYTQRGFTLSFTQKAQKIEESDLYGLSLIDMVYRGAQIAIELNGLVYGAGLTGPLWGWMTTFGQVYTASQPIGRLASSAGAALVLTAVPSTPAAAGGVISTFTSNPVIIAPDQASQIVLNSEMRTVPLRFDVLLTDTAGTGKLFTTT